MNGIEQTVIANCPADSNLHTKVHAGQTEDQSELLISLTTDDTPYLCPGESLPINRPLHLARLRAQYHCCKQCPHRLESEQFSTEAHHQLKDWWSLKEKTPDALRDGFGGQSPNDFSASLGRQIAETFALMQWERKIEQRVGSPLQETETASQTRPIIVVGHDFRETSLEMMRETVRGVREQGLQHY